MSDLVENHIVGFLMRLSCIMYYMSCILKSHLQQCFAQTGHRGTIRACNKGNICFLLKINRIHHGCPVEIGKSQPEGPPVPAGNEARRVSHWNGGPEGWDFPFSTGHP